MIDEEKTDNLRYRKINITKDNNDFTEGWHILNGLTFFGLNFVFLGVGSTWVFWQITPHMYISGIITLVGVLMVLDDVFNKQMIGKAILRKLVYQPEERRDTTE